MNRPKLYIIFIVVLFYSVNYKAVAQNDNFKEQLIGWSTLNFDNPFIVQSGIRYMPDYNCDTKWTDNFTINTNISFNAYTNTLIEDFEYQESDFKVKPYRLQIGIASNQLDLRVGLQKINFGSASLLRPLMWFDKIDPRDPLQLTDGVYGFLGRYYFLNNANIWLWGLYENREIKGWEVFKSDYLKPEVGGRIQYPLLKGEVALTYHYRDGLFKGSFADTLTTRIGFSENRYAIDGKFDLGIGLWFEAALIHQNLDFTEQKYQRIINLGADYTFGVGNGVSVIAEYFTYQKTESAFESGQGIDFIATSLSYPVNFINNIQAIVYYDISNNDYYRFVNFSWTYDNWIIYIMGFWNPENYQIYQNVGNTNLYGGYGAQLMVVFNH